MHFTLNYNYSKSNYNHYSNFGKISKELSTGFIDQPPHIYVYVSLNSKIPIHYLINQS